MLYTGPGTALPVIIHIANCFKATVLQKITSTYRYHADWCSQDNSSTNWSHQDGKLFWASSKTYADNLKPQWL